MRKTSSNLRFRQNANENSEPSGRGREWLKGFAAAMILALLLVPCLTTMAVSASQPPTLTVSASTQTLIADQENIVNVTVTNTGQFNAISTFMTVNLPSAGASGSPMILNGSDGRFYLGDIAPGDNTTITLHIIVSRAAAGSFYSISFTFNYQYSGQVTDTRNIGFTVPQLSPNAPRLDLTLSSQNLIAGASNNLTLTVRNTGNGTATSISVVLTLPGQGTSTAYTLLGGDGTWYIDAIGPGDESAIPLNIYVLPSVANTGTTFTVTTTFTDPQSKTNQQSNSFGILSLGSVNIVILSSSTYPSKVYPGAPFSLTVTLLNTGSTTAQSVIFTPNGTDQITPLSQSKIYLGDITVNVPSSLTLPFIAGNVTAGDYTLNIAYNYRNSLGMNMTGTLQIPFTIVLDTSNSTGSAQQPSTSSSSIYLIAALLIIIVVVIVVAYLIYRRRSRSN